MPSPCHEYLQASVVFEPKDTTLSALHLTYPVSSLHKEGHDPLGWARL